MRASTWIRKRLKRSRVRESRDVGNLGNEQILRSLWTRCCKRDPDYATAKSTVPEGRLVSEMLKRLPLVKIFEMANVFQERFMGKAQASDSWKIVQLVSLRKPDAERRKGSRVSGPDGSYVDVVRDVCCSSHGRRFRTEGV